MRCEHVQWETISQASLEGMTCELQICSMCKSVFRKSYTNKSKGMGYVTAFIKQ